MSSATTGVEVARISVKVSPDTRKFRSELMRDLEKIERQTKFNLAVELDQRNLQKQLGKLTQDGKATIRTDLDPAAAQAAMAATMSELQAIGRKGVEIRVGVDQRGLGGMTPGSLMPGLGGLAAGGGSAGGGLLGALGGGGDLTMLLKIGAVLAAIGPSINVVSTALTAIPGLLTGIATPIATLTMGIDGIKAAFEPLLPLFQGLKDSVGAVFQEGLAAPFQKLQGIIPTLSVGLIKVSDSLVQVFDSVISGLTSSVGMTAITDIFNNVANTLREAAPGIQSFITSFLQLAAAVTGSGLSEAFNSFAETFGRWVTQITTIGPNGLSPLQESLSGLLEVIKSVGPGLGELISNGLEGMKDPAFIENVKSTITGLMGFISAIAAVGNVMASLRSPIELLVGSFSTLAAILQSIPTIIGAAFSQAVGVVAGVVGQIVATVSAGFNGLVGIVQAAWAAVSAAVAAGVDAAVSFVASLPGKAQAALGNVAGLLVASGRALIQGFVDGIKGMIGAVVDAVGSVVSAARDLFPFSPAKEGPFSGKGWVYYSGQSVAQGFADGITDSTQSAVDATKGMMQSVSDEAKKGIDFGKLNMEAAQTMSQMPFDFADATARQFMSDIGVSGGGAVGAIADYGIGMARDSVTNIWNTSNVDDTMALYRNQTARQAMGIVNR